ncbi:MAG: molybdopterin oxidoreductase family protein [Gammaproteobacteria bacterium]
MTDPSCRIVRRACHLCEAICGLEIEEENGTVLHIRGDAEDPLSRGHVCPKAVALKDIHEDPDRLRKPVRREGSRWRECGWDEALDLTANRLTEISREHGDNAIGVYMGNPSVHNWGNLTHSHHFFRHFRTRNRFSATSVDQLPHHVTCFAMYGHQFLIPIPDIDHTDCFMMLGANPLASNGSLMTVPDFRNRIRALKSRGGRLIVIDPRRTETAKIADEHHFIRPGTDALLLLAMLQVLFSEKKIDVGDHQEYTDGLDQVARAVIPFTPDRVADATGLGAETIRHLAHTVADAPSAACYGRMGVSTQVFGSLCQWALQLLNLVTGNLDCRGGTVLTHAAIGMAGPWDKRPGHFGAWKSRVRGLPEFAGEIPVAALAEEITHGGDGQIRALATVAGNPVLSTPNGQQLDRALASLDFMVSFDFYLNETTRHANVILPPTSPLEHDHYDLIFHQLAVRNTARYSPPVFDKPPDSLHDWEIFNELAERCAGLAGTHYDPLPAPAVLLDKGLAAGPYGAQHMPQQALDLASLRAHDSGLDLGPLRPGSLRHRLCTDDGKIHAAPPELIADLKRLSRWLESDGPSSRQIRLIGRRHLRSNNSWMHNYARLVKGKDRCQLLMHPEDLARCGLQDGDVAEIRSRNGSLTVPVEACTDLMPGVVSLPHGWGHDRTGSRLSVARRHPGVCINDLTDETFLDELSGNAALNGVPVTITPTDATLR